MPENLVNSKVAPGLNKVSFHSSLKERQCQRMFKQPENCIHLTHQQSNVQRSPSQASKVHEMRNSRSSRWTQKRQRNQRSNCQHPLDDRKKQENSRKISTSSSLTILKTLTVWFTASCGKFLKRWEYQTTYLPPEKPVCRSRRNIQKKT